MFYAIHSTLNGIIPLSVVEIRGLMALRDLGFWGWIVFKKP